MGSAARGQHIIDQEDGLPLQGDSASRLEGTANVIAPLCQGTRLKGCFAHPTQAIRSARYAQRAGQHSR
jgi:hypothetical protein